MGATEKISWPFIEAAAAAGGGGGAMAAPAANERVEMRTTKWWAYKSVGEYIAESS